MRHAIIILTAAAFVAAPTAAFADSPAEGGYNSTPIVVPPGPKSAALVAGAQSQTAPSSARNGTAPVAAAAPPAQVTASSPVSKGALPFTGLDVGVIGLVAVALLGLGFGLRRAVRASAQRV